MAAQNPTPNESHRDRLAGLVKMVDGLFEKRETTRFPPPRKTGGLYDTPDEMRDPIQRLMVLIMQSQGSPEDQFPYVTRKAAERILNRTARRTAVSLVSPAKPIRSE